MLINSSVGENVEATCLKTISPINVLMLFINKLQMSSLKSMLSFLGEVLKYRNVDKVKIDKKKFFMIWSKLKSEVTSEGLLAW